MSSLCPRCRLCSSPLVLVHVLQEQTPPPRPEAYPIPTQTYTREYFTFPASKSQDRAAPPPPPHSQWPPYEEEPLVHTDGSHPSLAVQVSGEGFTPAPLVDPTWTHSQPRSRCPHRKDTTETWGLSVQQPCQRHLFPPGHVAGGGKGTGGVGCGARKGFLVLLLLGSWRSSRGVVSSWPGWCGI